MTPKLSAEELAGWSSAKLAKSLAIWAEEVESDMWSRPAALMREAARRLASTPPLKPKSR